MAQKAQGRVAAFGDFQVSVMLGGGQHPLSHKLLAVIGIQCLEQLGQLPGSEISVDLGYFFGQFIAVPLAQAAGDIHPFYPAILFGSGKLKDGLNALLLGTFDEAAGVDDHHGCSLNGRVMGDVKVVGPELVHEHL